MRSLCVAFCGGGLKRLHCYCILFYCYHTVKWKLMRYVCIVIVLVNQQFFGEVPMVYVLREDDIHHIF